MHTQNPLLLIGQPDDLNTTLFICSIPVGQKGGFVHTVRAPGSKYLHNYNFVAELFVLQRNRLAGYIRKGELQLIISLFQVSERFRWGSFASSFLTPFHGRFRVRPNQCVPLMESPFNVALKI